MAVLNLSKIKNFSTLLVLTAAVVSAGPAQAYDDVEARVTESLSKLSMDEKIHLLGGTDGFYTFDVPRVGLPTLKMSDGPVGSRNDGPSTAYPAGAMLAATWDTALAQREGAALGRDCRARGDHFILGPGVNIYRVPQNGRNFEYFGEDPYLAGKMAVAYIDGVQSQGVAACVKHFACNNQETRRGDVNVSIDERTLHEIYLPAFEAAVRVGHVRSIMASYNKVNGDWLTANAPLLDVILKQDWGFDGIAISDWGAVHDTWGPALAALDLEMPSAKYMSVAKLKPMVDSGEVPASVIDDKVRRLLRVTYQMQWDKADQKQPTIPLDDPASNRAALAVAREGLVLLKNEQHLLPFDPSKLHTLVLVGSNASEYAAGGGSSYVNPLHPTTILDGVKAIAGPGVNVIAIPYRDLDVSRMAEFTHKSVYESPLHAEYFNNPTLAGVPASTLDEQTIDHNWRRKMPVKSVTTETFSVRWTGKIKAAVAGDGLFAARADDGIRVRLDGKIILDDWSDHAARTVSAKVNLAAGESHDLVVEYYNAGGDASAQFGWGSVEPLLTDGDKTAITHADAVLACVGTHEAEGADRSYDLPAAQQQLLVEVTALNPHTVVVLNAGGNVGMTPWIDKAAGLLDAWFTGQAGGTAIAEVLFGAVNPSGHLPDTFEKAWTDSPAYGNYPGGDDVKYAEGIYVGYRWYDHNKIEPRFPFGYGLSYTTFQMNDLKVIPGPDLESGGDLFTATVTVTNTGKVAGAEVAQFYVRPPGDVTDAPVQQLKGFGRVELNPGESKTVTAKLDRRSFAYWDVDSHRWRVKPGTYTVAVGDSSRDERATASVRCK